MLDDSCIYEEEFYDCDGNCLSDTDGDGVCDELEAFGCTDNTECNYDPLATELDDCEADEVLRLRRRRRHRRRWRLRN